MYRHTRSQDRVTRSKSRTRSSSTATPSSSFAEHVFNRIPRKTQYSLNRKKKSMTLSSSLNDVEVEIPQDVQPHDVPSISPNLLRSSTTVRANSTSDVERYKALGMERDPSELLSSRRRHAVKNRGFTFNWREVGLTMNLVHIGMDVVIFKGFWHGHFILLMLSVSYIIYYRKSVLYLLKRMFHNR